MKKFMSNIIDKYGFPKVAISTMLIVFFALAIFLGLSLSGLIADSMVRIGMNGILVLALVPGIICGVGLNFGLSLGIVCGILGACISIELNLSGLVGILGACLISIPFSVLIGYVYGWILNKVKGEEMTIATYVGFSAISLMSIAWLLLPFTSPEMIWAIGGKGLRNTIAITDRFAKIFDNFLAIPIGSDYKLPTGTILVFLFACFLMYLFLKSKTGTSMSAAGDNPNFARASGISVDKQRMIGTILSTVLGGIGIIIYAQSFGFLQLYQAPLMMPFNAVAAILIGGATAKKANIGNVISGVILFQTLLTISLPVINKLMPGDISEVIRVIVSNGVILYALTKAGRDE